MSISRKLIAFALAKHAGWTADEQIMTLGCAAALTAMLGHVFPVWLGFQGGKGVATALGVYLALCWPGSYRCLIKNTMRDNQD